MMRTFASAVALSAMLGLPAMAQTNNATPTPSATPAPLSGSTSTGMQDSGGAMNKPGPAMGTTGNTPFSAGTGLNAGPSAAVVSDGMMSSGQLMSTLKNAGLANINDVKGHVIEARASNGQSVFMVIGPKDEWKSSNAIEFKQDDAIKSLEQSGLKSVKAVEKANILHGMIDDKDGDKEAVLALSGLNFQGGASAADQTGSTGGSFDKAQLEKSLNQHGFKAGTEFKGKLARAQAANGGTIYMIVGEEDLKAEKSDKPLKLDGKIVRESFEKGGLKNFSLIDDSTIWQGTINGHQVFVVTGKNLSKS